MSFHRAVALIELDRDGEAETAARFALRRADDATDAWEVAHARLALCLLDMRRGRFADAAATAAKLRDQFRLVADTRCEARMLVLEGFDAASLGDRVRAQQLLAVADELAVECGAPTLIVDAFELVMPGIIDGDRSNLTDDLVSLMLDALDSAPRTSATRDGP